MKIFKEVAVIIILSGVFGLIFNAFSPNGIRVLENPWSRKVVASVPGPADPVTFIGFEQACQFIDNQQGIILDARNPREFAEGHIPGARLLFFYNMNEYYPALEELLRSSPAILTYCNDVNCEDSEFLANELANLGHTSVFVYKGGIEDWKAHQMPLAQGMEEQDFD